MKKNSHTDGGHGYDDFSIILVGKKWERRKLGVANGTLIKDVEEKEEGT